MGNLYTFSNGGSIMSEAEALWRDDMIRKSIRREGIELGKKIGMGEDIDGAIKEMIIYNEDYEFISKITGKSIEYIMKIEKSMY